MDRVRLGTSGRDLVLVTVSALGMWLAFPPFYAWPLTFLSLAVLTWVIRRVNPGRAALYSALWAMVFMMPLISWMQIATGDTYLAWFALSGAEAFFIGLWGLTFSATSVWAFARKPFGEATTAAFLWVTFEEIRSRVPYGGFPWGKVSYPQVDSPLIWYAPLGGEVLVGFLVVFASVLLMRSFTGFGPSKGQAGSGVDVLRRAAAAFVAFGILLFPAGLSLPTKPQNGTLSVAVIQGNVEIPMAETFATPHKVTGNHVRQMETMVHEGHEVDLIIWGENAADLDPRVDAETHAMVNKIVRRAGVPLMLGIMEYGEGTRYNWTAVWDPVDGLLPDMYGKQHPVPWGEYIPLRGLTEYLATAAAQIATDMTAVQNIAIMDVTLADGRTVPLTVGICFEVAYEPLIVEGVQAGGEAIIIPTNNAHFQNSPESIQQLQMGQFHAAETSRALVQASTNGVSAIVAPDGSLQQMTHTQEAAHLVASLPLRTNITPLVYMGEWPALIIMGFGTLGSALTWIAWRKKKRRP